MPIYKHECQACGLEFEKLTLGRPAEERVTCPTYESREVKKLVWLASANRSSHQTSAPVSAACATGT